MSEFGAALQAYNQEIVKCLEELKRKREEMLDIICKQETNKSVLERNINVLKGKLDVLNERLDRDKSIFEQYEHTIKETEEGFKKILESSQALLQLAQHETVKLEQSSDSVSDTTALNHTTNSTYGIHY